MNKKALIVILLFGQFLLAQDDVDFSKEKRFHDIYKKYNENPTDDTSWKNVYKNSSQTYDINAGDTLWDISETFFGDPNYWPKIWSLNAHLIENPHEIIPKNKVTFVPGTLTEPPAMAVEEKPTEPIEEEPVVNTEAPAPEGTLATAETVAEKKEEAKVEDTELEGETSSLSAVEKQLELDTPLPPPVRITKPMGVIPNSLPVWYLSSINPKTQFTVDMKSLVKKYPEARMVLPFYLVDSLPEIKGTVIETEMGMSSASEYQFITIKLPSETPKHLLAIKEIEKIKDPVSGKKSTVVQVQGQIELLEVVNAEEKLYRAIVKSVVSPIEVNSQLVVQDWPVYDLRDGQPGPKVDADIIGGQNNIDRSLYGVGTILYLNQGAKAGLSQGQTLPVYRVQELRENSTHEKQNRRFIGKIKIVKTTEDFSTAIVLRESEEIILGDKTVKTSEKK